MAAALLAACTTLPPAPPRPNGIVIADEPLAAQAAARVLRQGGAAGDAAAALGLSLAVTFPVASGLGGGGRCLAMDGPLGVVESIAFEPQTPADGGPLAVPMQVAGLAYLQGRYGVRPWGEAVAPARELAEGFSASRAFVRRLAGDAALSATPEAYAVMFGGILTDGQRVEQPDLAATLRLLARDGAGAFYAGVLADRLLAANAREGGRLTAADLARAVVAVRPAGRGLVGTSELLLPAEDPSGAGRLAAALWARLAGAPPEDDAADAILATWQAGHADVPRGDLGATAFVVGDDAGRLIVCALTMNGPFGARAMAGDLGFAFALVPGLDGAGHGAELLQPMLLRGPDGGASVIGAAGGLAAWTGGARLVRAIAGGDPAAGKAGLKDLEIAPLQSLPVLTCDAAPPSRTCRFLPTPGGSGTAQPIGPGYGLAY